MNSFVSVGWVKAAGEAVLRGIHKNGVFVNQRHQVLPI